MDVRRLSTLAPAAQTCFTNGGGWVRRALLSSSDCAYLCIRIQKGLIMIHICARPLLVPLLLSVHSSVENQYTWSSLYALT